jgi:hypothetical protein
MDTAATASRAETWGTRIEATLARYGDLVRQEAWGLSYSGRGRVKSKWRMTEDELREHFAGEIAAARARGLAPVFNFEPGDDDLVEPAREPRRGAPKPHRIRTPSLTKALREAKKAAFL